MKTMGVLVLSFFCLSTSVHAAKQLTIMTIELPPYAYKEGDQVAGFATDIVRLALNRMNIKYKVMIQPWARSLLAMQSGSIDGLFPMFKTNERMVFTLYPEKPLVFQYTSLFTHQGFTIQFDGNYSTLTEYRICSVRGFSSGPEFDLAVKNKVLPYVEYAESSLQNLEKILMNRCQILVDDKIVVLSLLKKSKNIDKLTAFADIDKSASFLGFSKKTTNVQQVNAFNQVLNKMLAEGVVSKIIDSYIKPASN